MRDIMMEIYRQKCGSGWLFCWIASVLVLNMYKDTYRPKVSHEQTARAAQRVGELWWGGRSPRLCPRASSHRRNKFLFK